MRHLLTILAALLLCSAPLHAQTLKSLMYNTTNGFVTYSGTNTLRFNTLVSFDGGPLINASGIYWDTSSGGLNLEEGYINDISGTTIISWSDGNSASFGRPLTFNNTTNAATTRANLGFSTNLNTLWTASNAATAARALSGSTNTNHPYSGSISVVGTNNTNTLVFSNGILQSVQ